MSRSTRRTGRCGITTGSARVSRRSSARCACGVPANTSCRPRSPPCRSRPRTPKPPTGRRSPREFLEGCQNRPPCCVVLSRPPLRGGDIDKENVMSKPQHTDPNMPPIVSPQEWDTARQELLIEEKQLTRAHDALAAKRRRMPRMEVEKQYRFEGPNGPAGLLDLFEGRRQLIIYRFFFEPGVSGWPEGGCLGCSLMADQVAHLAHLNARDTTYARVSRAPQPDIERLKARMGWDVPWYTITDDFDADFGVDEWHGTNVFLREGDRVFRTYFVNNRGDEALGSTW